MINRIAFKKRPTASLKMRHSENEKLIVFLRLSIIRIFAANINDMINFSKHNLIGFAGTIGSGKDTAAEILNYQRLQGTYATYKAWKRIT